MTNAFKMANVFCFIIFLHNQLHMSWLLARVQEKDSTNRYFQTFEIDANMRQQRYVIDIKI